MSVKIAICDDSAKDTEILSKALLDYDHTFNIISYSDGALLMDTLLGGEFTADILFLDIFMPGLDGIRTAQQIRAIYKDLLIIFITTSKDFYPQAYEVFAFNYVIKPFSREQLYTVLQRALEAVSKTDNYKILIQYKGISHTVDCRDILYIESQSRLLLFFLADGNVLRCYGKLDEMEWELPKQYFLRCHQSFMVNLSYVSEMGDKYFRVGKSLISISKKYWKDAKDKYYAYLFSSMDGGHPL